MTVWIALTCPGCQSTNIVKNGKSRLRKQRYRCLNKECPRCTFIIDYEHNDRDPEVKQKLLKWQSMEAEFEIRQECYQ